MKIFKWLLFPFAVLYDLITRLRNHLYNIGYHKSFDFETNVISVGNLTVGGTGKTPMVEYLIRLLSGKYQVATLSRGYGRKTRGFLEGNIDSTKVSDIGDEPFQYLLKFHEKTGVFVGEERAWAIPGILLERPRTQIIVLDDAYQHRSVLPDLNILMTKYNRLFSSDYLMPVGRLRESRLGARRADAVVVSKCPEQFDEAAVRAAIEKYTTPVTPIFFTSVAYGMPVSFWSDEEQDLQGKSVVLISGIASADDLEAYVRQEAQLLRHFRFSDHHRYRADQLNEITGSVAGQEGIFLTTEKDFVKLREFEQELRDLPFYYLPIEIRFRGNKKEFDELIYQSLKTYNTPDGADD